MVEDQRPLQSKTDGHIESRSSKGCVKNDAKIE